MTNEIHIEGQLVKYEGKLDEKDFSLIDRLCRFRNICSECGKNLVTDTLKRNILLTLTSDDPDIDPALYNKTIKIVCCNACGLRDSKRRIFLAKQRARKVQTRMKKFSSCLPPKKRLLEESNDEDEPQKKKYYIRDQKAMNYIADDDDDNDDDYFYDE